MYLKRLKITVFFLLIASFICVGGCARWYNPWKKGGLDKSLKNDEEKHGRVTFVRDYASVYGLHLASLEGFGLVYNLRGNGAPTPLGGARDYMLHELQKMGVERPSELLDSKDTAVVRLQGILPPGLQEGDNFDVKVSVIPGSEVRSLQGGYLMKSALKEMQQLVSGSVSQSFSVGYVEGPIMLNPSANEKTNSYSMVSGRILGGGVARKSRQLSLLMKEEHISEIITARIEKKINERFFMKVGSKTRGVATARTDTKIDVDIHPAYKNNVERYIQVLFATGCYESQNQRSKRIESLKKSLLVPATSQDSAIQLEAIGKAGIEALKEGLKSDNIEVRFYSAEALAYLNVPQAAEPLAEIAREEQAFRVFALGALSTMQTDLDAERCLRMLLHEKSAETRYGAFRALWFRNPNDLTIRGETLGKNEGYKFNYHVLSTNGPSMIHVTTNKRPELVLFNHDIRLLPDFALDAGKSILVQSVGADEVVVTRFAVGRMMDEKRTVTNRLDDVVRAIVDLGGTYPDIVQMLIEANSSRALPCKLEIDKLPQAGRVYSRSAEDEFVEERKKSFWNKFNPNTWIEEGNTVNSGGSDWKD